MRIKHCPSGCSGGTRYSFRAQGRGSPFRSTWSTSPWAPAPSRCWTVNRCTRPDISRSSSHKSVAIRIPPEPEGFLCDQKAEGAVIIALQTPKPFLQETGGILPGSDELPNSKQHIPGRPEALSRGQRPIGPQHDHQAIRPGGAGERDQHRLRILGSSDDPPKRPRLLEIHLREEQRGRPSEAPAADDHRSISTISDQNAARRFHGSDEGGLRNGSRERLPRRQPSCYLAMGFLKPPGQRLQIYDSTPTGSLAQLLQQHMDRHAGCSLCTGGAAHPIRQRDGLPGRSFQAGCGILLDGFPSRGGEGNGPAPQWLNERRVSRSGRAALDLRHR